MNTFFKAILLATANKRMMQYSDEWRAFHKYFTLEDRENKKYYRKINNILEKLKV